MKFGYNRPSGLKREVEDVDGRASRGNDRQRSLPIL